MTAPSDDALSAACRRTGRPTTSSASCSRAGRRRICSSRRSPARDGAPTFVFFEGPPTANGRPGIHHVFSRTIKDLFCRHRAMKGFRVARKAGWDTHGLPVEIEVEKQLGISGKQQIEALGVAEFNRLCRESVFKYRGDWERLSARIGVLARLRASVRHVHERLCRERVVGAEDAVRQGAAVSRAQDSAVLPALRHGAVEPRGRAGLQDVEDPSVYIALDACGTTSATRRSAGRGRRSSCGRRRRGRSCRTPRSPCIRISTTSS